jgi:hypothetical protein
MTCWHDVELASAKVEDGVMNLATESEVVVADKEQNPRESGARPSYFRSPLASPSYRTRARPGSQQLGIFTDPVSGICLAGSGFFILQKTSAQLSRECCLRTSFIVLHLCVALHSTFVAQAHLDT